MINNTNNNNDIIHTDKEIDGVTKELIQLMLGKDNIPKKWSIKYLLDEYIKGLYDKKFENSDIYKYVNRNPLCELQMFLNFYINYLKDYDKKIIQNFFVNFRKEADYMKELYDRFQDFYRNKIFRSKLHPFFTGILKFSDNWDFSNVTNAIESEYYQITSLRIEDYEIDDTLLESNIIKDHHYKNEDYSDMDKYLIYSYIQYCNANKDVKLLINNEVYKNIGSDEKYIRKKLDSASQILQSKPINYITIAYYIWLYELFQKKYKKDSFIFFTRIMENGNTKREFIFQLYLRILNLFYVLVNYAEITQLNILKFLIRSLHNLMDSKIWTKYETSLSIDESLRFIFINTIKNTIIKFHYRDYIHPYLINDFMTSFNPIKNVWIKYIEFLKPHVKKNFIFTDNMISQKYITELELCINFNTLIRDNYSDKYKFKRDINIMANKSDNGMDMYINEILFDMSNAIKPVNLYRIKDYTKYQHEYMFQKGLGDEYISWFKNNYYEESNGNILFQHYKFAVNVISLIQTKLKMNELDMDRIKNEISVIQDSIPKDKLSLDFNDYLDYFLLVDKYIGHVIINLINPEFDDYYPNFTKKFISPNYYGFDIYNKILQFYDDAKKSPDLSHWINEFSNNDINMTYYIYLTELGIVLSKNYGCLYIFRKKYYIFLNYWKKHAENNLLRFKFIKNIKNLTKRKICITDDEDLFNKTQEELTNIIESESDYHIMYKDVFDLKFLNNKYLLKLIGENLILSLENKDKLTPEEKILLKSYIQKMRKKTRNRFITNAERDAFKRYKSIKEKKYVYPNLIYKDINDIKCDTIKLSILTDLIGKYNKDNIENYYNNNKSENKGYSDDNLFYDSKMGEYFERDTSGYYKHNEVKDDEPDILDREIIYVDKNADWMKSDIDTNFGDVVEIDYTIKAITQADYFNVNIDTMEIVRTKIKDIIKKYPTILNTIVDEFLQIYYKTLKVDPNFILIINEILDLMYEYYNTEFNLNYVYNVIELLSNEGLNELENGEIIINPGENPFLYKSILIHFKTAMNIQKKSLLTITLDEKQIEEVNNIAGMVVDSGEIIDSSEIVKKENVKIESIKMNYVKLQKDDEIVQMDDEIVQMDDEIVDDVIKYKAEIQLLEDLNIEQLKKDKNILEKQQRILKIASDLLNNDNKKIENNDTVNFVRLIIKSFINTITDDAEFNEDSIKDKLLVIMNTFASKDIEYKQQIDSLLEENKILKKNAADMKIPNVNSSDLNMIKLNGQIKVNEYKIEQLISQLESINKRANVKDEYIKSLTYIIKNVLELDKNQLNKLTMALNTVLDNTEDEMISESFEQKPKKVNALNELLKKYKEGDIVYIKTIRISVSKLNTIENKQKEDLKKIDELELNIIKQKEEQNNIEKLLKEKELQLEEFDKNMDELQKSMQVVEGRIIGQYSNMTFMNVTIPKALGTYFIKWPEIRKELNKEKKSRGLTIYELLEEHIKKYSTEVQNIFNEKVDYELKLNNALYKISILEKELTEVKNKKNEKTKILEELNNELEAAMTNARELSFRNDELELKLKNLTVELDLKKSEIDKLQVKYKAEIQLLKEKNDIEKSELENRIKELENKLEEITLEKETLIQNKEKEIKILEQTINDNNKTKIKNNEDIAETYNEIQKLKIDLDLKKKEINKLRDEITTLQIENNKNKASSIQYIVVKKQTEIDDLTRTKKQLNEEYETLKKNNQINKIKIKNLETDKIKLEDEIKKLRLEKEKIENGRSELIIKNNVLNEQIKNSEIRIEKQQNTINELEKELDIMRTKMLKLMEKIKEKENENAELVKQYESDINTKNIEIDEQKKILKQITDQYDKEILKLNLKIKELEEINNGLLNEINKLKKELTQNHTDMEKTIEEYQNKIKELKKQINKYEVETENIVEKLKLNDKEMLEMKNNVLENNTEQNKKLVELEEQKEILEKELIKTHSKIDDLNNEMENERLCNEEIISVFKKKQNELEQNMNDQKLEYEKNLKIKDNIITKDIANYTKLVDSSDIQILELNKKIKLMYEQREQLEVEHKKILDIKNEELNTLIKEKKDLITLIRDFNENKYNKEVEITTLENIIIDLRNKIDDMSKRETQYKIQYAEFEKTTVEYKKLLKENQRLIDNLVDKETEMKNIEERGEQLKIKLQEKNTENLNLKKQIEEKIYELKLTKTKLENYLLNINNTRSQLDIKKNEYDFIVLAKKDLEDKLALIRGQNEYNIEIIKKYEQEIIRYKIEIQVLNADIIQTIKDKELFIKERDVYQEKYTTLLVEYNILNEFKEQVVKNNTELIEENDKFKKNQLEYEKSIIIREEYEKLKLQYNKNSNLILQYEDERKRLIKIIESQNLFINKVKKTIDENEKNLLIYNSNILKISDEITVNIKNDKNVKEYFYNVIQDIMDGILNTTKLDIKEVDDKLYKILLKIEGMQNRIEELELLVNKYENYNKLKRELQINNTGIGDLKITFALYGRNNPKINIKPLEEQIDHLLKENEILKLELIKFKDLYTAVVSGGGAGGDPSGGMLVFDDDKRKKYENIGVQAIIENKILKNENKIEKIISAEIIKKNKSPIELKIDKCVDILFKESYIPDEYINYMNIINGISDTINQLIKVEQIKEKNNNNLDEEIKKKLDEDINEYLSVIEYLKKQIDELKNDINMDQDIYNIQKVKIKDESIKMKNIINRLGQNIPKEEIEKLLDNIDILLIERDKLKSDNDKKIIDVGIEDMLNMKIEDIKADKINLDDNDIINLNKIVNIQQKQKQNKDETLLVYNELNEKKLKLNELEYDKKIKEDQNDENRAIIEMLPLDYNNPKPISSDINDNQNIILLFNTHDFYNNILLRITKNIPVNKDRILKNMYDSNLKYDILIEDNENKINYYINTQNFVDDFSLAYTYYFFQYNLYKRNIKSIKREIEFDNKLIDMWQEQNPKSNEIDIMTKIYEGYIDIKSAAQISWNFGNDSGMIKYEQDMSMNNDLKEIKEMFKYPNFFWKKTSRQQITNKIVIYSLERCMEFDDTKYLNNQSQVMLEECINNVKNDNDDIIVISDNTNVKQYNFEPNSVDKINIDDNVDMKNVSENMIKYIDNDKMVIVNKMNPPVSNSITEKVKIFDKKRVIESKNKILENINKIDVNSNLINNKNELINNKVDKIKEISKLNINSDMIKQKNKPLNILKSDDNYVIYDNQNPIIQKISNNPKNNKSMNRLIKENKSRVIDLSNPINVQNISNRRNEYLQQQQIYNQIKNIVSDFDLVKYDNYGDEYLHYYRRNKNVNKNIVFIIKDLNMTNNKNELLKKIMTMVTYNNNINIYDLMKNYTIVIFSDHVMRNNNTDFKERLNEMGYYDNKYIFDEELYIYHKDKTDIDIYNNILLLS
jgi:hypothetical protein